MRVIAHSKQQFEDWRDGVRTRMLVSAVNGAAQLCIFEQWVSPETGAPTHHHPVEEVLTVISGKAEMWIDDDHAVLTEGASLVIPAHRKHGFRNVGSQLLHINAVLASSIFDATFDSVVVQRWQISN
jgi:mannose-6-phosphate isomerase-like protein (cupin superfamily)